MSERIRYAGLDVSKDSIAVAVAEPDGTVATYGTIANDPGAVRRLVEKLSGDAVLHAAYEAGPTGYALHRQLIGLGVRSQVVAPTLIPRQPGNRVKTDRRDALQLVRLLRRGDLVAVWVPDQAHEALRDLVRARDDARTDALRAKHRLSKFLLRQGVVSPARVGKAWSMKYQAWLNTLTFSDRPAQLTFDDYLSCVRSAAERLRRLDAALVDCAAQSPHGEMLRALQAVRGIGFLTAITIVAEAGDLRRFHSAGAFMAYVGLVPSEHSSGATRRRGHITKTGNRLLRHVLGEAAHHARLQPAVSDALRRRQTDVSQEVIDISWRCQTRLHHKYRHLGARLGRPRALTAVARELAGFVWAMGQLAEATPA
jgi:transposase